ncbi:ABC transporter ATP-binding protein [Actinomyces oris]|nr:ABC transporter ATP-binding protein [Actinomyces oris]
MASSDPTAAPASSLPSATPPAGPGPTSPVAIRLRGLTRVYEVPGRQDARVTALDHVDADLPEGSFTAVVGASGSGKSTLLHCMAGLDEPTSGQVTMLGALTSGMRAAERARFRARHVGFVFQEYNLIASLSAADNVSMPSRLAGRPLNGAQTREALDAVGLAHRAGLKPHQLSGGERQRVAIARVMASRPRIVFADEPTGALDLDSAALVLDWLRRLTEQGTTVVMVTHDVEAAARADAVAVMSQGHLVQWTDCRDARQIAELVHSARAARAA